MILVMQESRASSMLFVVVILAAVPLACTKPLSARRDAGEVKDASAEDRAADLPVEATALPDLPADQAVLPDLATPDLTDVGGLPKLFRIENHTDRTAYATVDPTVACHVFTDFGWMDCSFFGLSCLVSCSTAPASGDCCEQCEQPLPALLPIGPGESRDVPWNGKLYTRLTGACSTCGCQQETMAQDGTFEASVLVYADYVCNPSPCDRAADGSIVMANPRGSSITVTTPFTVPSADEDVVLAITSLPTTDAGTSPDLGPPDHAPTDLATPGERSPDALPGPFADLPGHTFGIAASNTPPDASSNYFNWPCRSSDLNATYNLIFSDDGTKVHIVRTDPVQEETMDGVLSAQSDAQLVYSIDNHWAGAELVVRIDNGTHAAELAVFGSGVPVVMCIESPMTAS